MTRTRYHKATSKKKISLKKTPAWKWTSLLVRLRSANKSGVVQCFTCGNYHHYKNLDAGHYASAGQHKATFFDLDGLRPQCDHCNRWLNGAPIKFRANLVKEIGLEAVETYEAQAQMEYRWTPEELKQISDTRREKVKKILEEIS